jgi:photosystem II stability/assembly factor-like uncharacterized protein
LTYGSVAGPNNVENGAVWKYNPKDGTWSDISPEKSSGQQLSWGYGAVAVDARHPATIMATTVDRWGPHDEVFRSTDGGLTWKGILVDGRMDYSAAPYTSRMTPHWTCSLAINPNDSAQVMFGTGYGIWATTNATATDSGGRVTWVFFDKGLEETVPLALISPPSGAHLISGLGDIDGFRHDDLDVSPAEGSFGGVRFSTTRDLGFAALKPDTMVRIGDSQRGRTHASYSEDGGKTWQPLLHDPKGENPQQGRIAISADGRVVVWTMRRGAAWVSPDRGATWTLCAGVPAGSEVVADTVNASQFYSFDLQAGRLLVSTNFAASFEAAGPALLATQSGETCVLCATPGRQGDVWVSCHSCGFYHSSDGGTSFSKIEKVSGADAVGFGMAAPGRTFPALYLLGNVSDVHGFYRSDDIGATWVRINDDQHQFGVADRPLVAGDPRVYGRIYLTTGGRGIIYGEPSLPSDDAKGHTAYQGLP